METKYLIEHLHEWHENLISELCKDDVMTCDDLCGYPGPCIVIQAADLLEAQQKRIAELEAAIREREERRWIPVTERLPDRNGEYICRHGYNGNTDIKFTGVLEYYATSEKPHWQHESIGLIVTHWMPLPEPPKEDA